MVATRLRPAMAALAFALAFLCAAAAASAEESFPNRPIKMLVGFSAGGGTDVAARIVAQQMGALLGQTIVVENRPGASGLLAIQDLAKSDPDGYTLMMGSQTTCAVAPALYRKVAVDPAKDFSGVALTSASPLVLVVNPASPAHSVKDVIAMAKAEPSKMIFGTGGVGTTPHMAAEMFQHEAGIKLVHVAYRGEAGAINDLIAGQIPLMFANLSAVMGNVKAGTLRALAVTSAKRSPSVPDIPTVAESALPGFAVETWWGILAPPGTPLEIRRKLSDAARQSVDRADTKERYAQLGMTTLTSSPEELDAYIRSEVATWARVIKDAGVQPLD